MSDYQKLAQAVLRRSSKNAVLSGAGIDVQFIHQFTERLLDALYPERCDDKNLNSAQALEAKFQKLEADFLHVMNMIFQIDLSLTNKWQQEFFNILQEISELLELDRQSFINNDPAIKNDREIILCYPGFKAIACYRFSHALFEREVAIIPRIISEYAHSVTGIDIHPGAEIGNHFFIDHGTGVVIGETAHVGNHVKIYQGVTLGALSVSLDLKNKKRHPTIGDNVVIYANATILGGTTTVGNHSIIGGSVWLTKSIPNNCVVYHKSEMKTDIKNSEQFEFIEEGLLYEI